MNPLYNRLKSETAQTHPPIKIIENQGVISSRSQMLDRIKQELDQNDQLLDSKSILYKDNYIPNGVISAFRRNAIDPIKALVLVNLGFSDGGYDGWDTVSVTRLYSLLSQHRIFAFSSIDSSIIAMLNHLVDIDKMGFEDKCSKIVSGIQALAP